MADADSDSLNAVGILYSDLFSGSLKLSYELQLGMPPASHNSDHSDDEETQDKTTENRDEDGPPRLVRILGAIGDRRTT